MIVIPTNTRSRNNGSNTDQAKAAQRAKRKAKAEQDYQEDAGWGSAFHRPENEAPQPSYTGNGVLDSDTLKAIHEAGGEFQISVWTRRARTGTKYLRVHIEAPYQGGSEDAELDEDEFTGPVGSTGPEEDDMPF